MKILFVNLSGLRFNVATPDAEPLGGTESALCYLARHLALNGHDVSFVAHLPDNTPHIIHCVKHAAPNVLLTNDFVAAQNFDAIIVNNTPVAGATLRLMAPHALLLLWSHVVPDHPGMRELAQPVVRDSYDGFIFVSHWQQKEMEQAFGLTKPRAVIGNGFAPTFENLFASPSELLATKENRAAYTTTPFRGLSVLLDVMNGFGMGTQLDLYSSMKVYQSESKDTQYASLYDRASQNHAITQHGAVSQKELAQRLKPAAFFAYPSIYAETFCIAALEARAAGLKVITTATAALPEVLQHSADFVAISAGNPQKLVADFRSMLEMNVKRFLENPKEWAEERFADVQNVNRHYTWAARAKEWELLLSTTTKPGT